LTDKPYCYFHTRLHRLNSKPSTPFDSVELPVLEDRSAIQLALSQVLSALGSSRLDTKRAGLFLYGLQIASQNVDRSSDAVPQDTVEVLSSDSDGQELAPEQSVCEPPNDCYECAKKKTCENYESGECDGCDQKETCEEYKDMTGNKTPVSSAPALGRALALIPSPVHPSPLQLCE
jgi:hypothetical protein